ncbi:MAG: hypothetical protein AB7N61_02735 [Acidimicrobiia bacterium]
MLFRPPGVAPGNIDDLVVKDTGYRDGWTSESIGVDGAFADAASWADVAAPKSTTSTVAVAYSIG